MDKKAEMLAELKKVAQEKHWRDGGCDLMWFDNADGMSVGFDWVEEWFFVVDLNDRVPSVASADYAGLDIVFESEEN
jgi:hypothetical protein